MDNQLSQSDGVHRRRVLSGIATGTVIIAGCSDIDNSPINGNAGGTGGVETVTHAGLRMRILYHRRTGERIRPGRDSDDEPCIQIQTPDAESVFLFVGVEIKPIDSNSSGVSQDQLWDILESSRLVCGEMEFEVQSLASYTPFDYSESESVERGEVGFQLPETQDGCQLRVGWRGSSSSKESFQLGLGRKRSREKPPFRQCPTPEN